ncbi:MAG: hypothetical protein ACRD3S_07205 [Terracidiphilus sp.]
MSVALNGSRELAQIPEISTDAGTVAESSASENRNRTRRATKMRPSRYASDDEILGITSAASPARANGSDSDTDPLATSAGAEADAAVNGARGSESNSATPPESSKGAQVDAQIQEAFDANPELLRAWQDAQSYRQAFSTPEEARAATELLSDLNRMDALFFSRRPEDHAELARAVASLDAAAFTSLAQAMGNFAAAGHQHTASGAVAASDATSGAAQPAAPANPTPAQVDFLHSANAAAVQGVLDAIETQVDRLLPEGVSKTARNRVVGEIYRELDSSLGSNRQLGQQMRDALRSGNLDAQHQRAIVSMVTGRARQALPGIAKRVLNEWTSTVVAANQDRLSRQRAAAHRVDIAGSGRGADGGRRSLGPRDVDYTRMSDSDILNL